MEICYNNLKCVLKQKEGDTVSSETNINKNVLDKIDRLGKTPQQRACAKYLAEKVDTLRIRVPKGKREIIKAHASQQGESMNQFVVRAIDETMQRDTE